MKSRYMLLVGITLTITAAPAAAIAQQATTTFPVSATVLKACSVTASALNFGSYDPTAAAGLEGMTNLRVLCTVGTSYTIGLSPGTSAGATVTSRKMINGENSLNYELFQEAARTNNWGSTPGTNTPPATSAGTTPRQHTVYGRIPAGQIVPAGAYTDTITVSVNY